MGPERDRFTTGLDPISINHSQRNPLQAARVRQGMARPRVPHHLKPVPTTISLAVHHRRWMDEGGLSPSAVVNRLLDTHRADIEADREHRRAIEKVERAIHVLKERDEEAEALAMSFVSDPENVPASRLAAMLLARIQAGEDAGPAGTILLDALSAPEAAPEAPEAAPVLCEALTRNGRGNCTRNAVRGGFCEQHARMFVDEDRWS